MLDKLEAIHARYQEIEQQMNDPQVTSDMKRYVKLSKDYKDLQPVVKAYHDYKALLDTIAECRELLATEKDEELREMAKAELAECNERREKMEDEIRILLIPEDPTDSKNAVVEIRGGTGGDEACIFAGDLFRMYTRYCEKKHWHIEVISFNEGTAGDYKDITFNVTGEKVYGMLKYESGVHRVQRVPATETQGRVHTSAAGVVVLPEAEEFDVELNMSDVKKETFCASGPGGQCVNTTYSASASPTSPPASSSPCRTRNHKSKTSRKLSPSSAHASTSANITNTWRNSPPNAKPWSPRATAARRSAPTTTPKAASPTTASATPCTTSPPLWTATSKTLSTPSSWPKTPRN